MVTDEKNKSGREPMTDKAARGQASLSMTNDTVAKKLSLLEEQVFEVGETFGFDSIGLPNRRRQQRHFSKRR